MGLRGQKSIVLADFQGKRTTGNLSQQDLNTLLRCDGVTRYGDGPLETAPTQVALSGFVPVSGDGGIATIYDFIRNVDAKHFWIFSQGNQVKYITPSAHAPTVTVFNPGGVVTTHYWDFVQNSFILYGADYSGGLEKRFVDVGGTLTPYKWGIDPPANAPSVALGTAGTTSFAHGRRYVYAYVSKYTDSLGITRVSVGAASPISAYSGPTTLQNVAVGVLASADPQVTNIWVFSTFDAVDGTQDTYYFNAELTNANQTYEDGLLDAALDQSRTAPWDNYPAPDGIIALAMYQNRVVAVGRDFIQFSANGETSLGIDQENFPPSLFIQLPAGALRPITARVLNSNDPSKESLWIGTLNGWYPVTAIAQNSITLGDKIVMPGTVGNRSAAITPTHIVWLGPDKRLWGWNGVSSYLSEVPAQALDFSEAIWTAIAGTAGTESIQDSVISFAEARWFSKGSQHFILLASKALSSGTPINPYFVLNWFVLWQVEIKGPQITAIRACDIYPQGSGFNGNFLSTAVVDNNGSPVLLAGDGAGQIWDLLGTFGSASQPRISTAWLHDESNADCRWLFVDIETDQTQPEQKFTVLAVAAESPDMTKTTMNVRQIPDPRANSVNSTRFRCILEGSQGVCFGKYLRLEVLFPTGNNHVKVNKIEVSYQPMFVGTP